MGFEAGCHLEDNEPTPRFECRSMRQYFLEECFSLLLIQGVSLLYYLDLSNTRMDISSRIPGFEQVASWKVKLLQMLYPDFDVSLVESVLLLSSCFISCYHALSPSC